MDVGTFSQDRLVYAVRFANGLLMGCLEGELAPRDGAGSGGRLDSERRGSP